MTEGQVAIKNLKISYKTFGNGEKTLLILHGWKSNSERWQKAAELLAEKGVTVIVPDLPGFGKSQEPSEAWSLDNYVEWLAEFCRQVPGLEDHFYLAGHSFGGALAAKFALKYPQKVQKLFLVSAACVRQMKFSKKAWYRLSKMVKIFSFVPYYPLARKAFYKFILRKTDYLQVDGVMKGTYLKGVSEDLSYKINFLKVPVVIIWGDKDTSTPIDQARFIHERIPHSTLIVIPGANHSLQMEVPEQLAEKILQNI
ncbi:MAG: alpha/beta hydrolase [bacterium]|nr:alpha/beta hydrolase [bacterium]